MFTGIIESQAKIVSVKREGSNIDFEISSPISSELKVDQSVAHDGVCLTVVNCDSNSYVVTAIQETLDKTSLGNWEAEKTVNVERAMISGARLDGHMVQGHVDGVGVCKEVQHLDGSWNFRFSYPTEFNHLLVEKGSICINGVSLTLVDVVDDAFSVCIIPYTFEHTNFGKLQAGDKVNLEFDIIGKYVSRMMEAHLQKNTTTHAGMV